MAQKKSSRTSWGFGKSPQSLAQSLEQVDKYLIQKQWSKARENLEELTRRSPEHPEVLKAWLSLAYELGDWQDYQQRAEKFTQICPDEPDGYLALGAAYLHNHFPLLAFQAFRQFQEKFPRHAQAKKAEGTLRDLETKLPQLLDELGLHGEQALEAGQLHERSRSYLEAGQYPQACELLQQLLVQVPNFCPALNNLSLAYHAQGKTQDAIATAQKVLQEKPENLQARSNLIRFYVVSGQFDLAQKESASLKKLKSEVPDSWLKKAEALSFLGEMESLVQLGEQASSSEVAGQISPLFWHWVAVAHSNLGQDQKARQLWQKALQIQPGLALARQNLDNLKLPVGERQSPWAFELQDWLSPSALEDLHRLAHDPSQARAGKKGKRLLQRFVEEHPEVVALVPCLLERGDPLARELALRLSMDLKTPELLAALKAFALGNRGPDRLRLEAAQVASQEGLMPSGMVKMWNQGEQKELLLMAMEISERPSVTHSKPVRQLAGEGILALKAGAAQKAESLFQEALALEPDSPDIKFNLVSTYQLQGRGEEARALLTKIHQDYPDYAFAPILLARQHLQKKEVEAAQKLLDPLLQRQHFHFQEFSQFCEAEIELSLAKKLPEAARTWLGMWERVAPDDAALSYWQKRLADKKSWFLK